MARYQRTAFSSWVAGKPMHAAFDGGRLTSDTGVLVLADIERRLGIAERLACCIADPRSPERIHHTLSDMIRFRVLLIAAGYPNANDCDAATANRHHERRYLQRLKTSRRRRHQRASPRQHLPTAVQGGGIDLARPAEELGRPRAAMRQEPAGPPEQDEAVGAVTEAEKAARQGDWEQEP
jgi:hypothetical protein